MNESKKQEIYKKWQERGSPWFDLDPSKEPTYAEKQIIIEIKKIQAGIKVMPKPVNEIKEFDRFINNACIFRNEDQ